ncbi:MAG TPA: hypothetical protein DCM28_01180 [Phycisphaerales bacterium]|nr:hypothetical protein [Phycisphaerales bacterium]HCD31402.1 hypothetical protein [Phycisphaerales bacterium]|tara:strand:- start:458 stop:1510 length:1053 start_codon:yes stop_codon:yes gene_type:complete
MCEDHVDPVEIVLGDNLGYVDIASQLLTNYRCNVRSVSFSTFTAPWGIHAPPSNVGGAITFTFFAMLRGQCYFQDQTQSEPVRLKAGDIFLFRNDCENTLKDNPQSSTIQLLDILTEELVESQLGLTLGGGGKATRMMIGFFVFKQGEALRLLKILPRYIHVHGDKGRLPSEAVEVIHQINDEIVSKRAGWKSASDYMTRALLVKVMRHYELQQRGEHSPEYNQVMQDPEIFQALKSLHKQPGLNWTVSSLAEEVGMSRSAFAARFQQCMDQTPMAYLHEIRMHWACSLLRDESIGIKRIAMQLGYSSDASFSSAFKRWAGKSPGQFRKSRDLSPEHQSNLYLRVLIDGE